MTDPIRSVHGLLESRARQDPAAVALLAPGRPPLCFGELLEQVAYVVASLNRLGVGQGDAVALLMPNGPEMAAALLAISAGAAVAPLNPGYRERELARYFEELDPKLLIVQAGFASPARAIAKGRGIPALELTPQTHRAAGRFAFAGVPLEEPGSVDFSGPDDLALLLHTSGTTSQPKIVPLSHRNICTSVGDVCRTLLLGPADRCLNVMPLYHVGGLVDLLLSPLSVGGSVVCTPGFSAAELPGWLEQYQPTWLQAVPTMLQEIASRMGGGGEAGPAVLRFVRSVAAPLPDAVRESVEAIFACPVVETYGMTEAAPLITSTALPPALCKPGSLGRSVGPDLAVMDPQGERLPAHQLGEIAIRGDNVMAGYLNAPEANALAFQGGWFRTGDLGFLDEDGFLYLRGRVKEMINRGGEKISPVEIDEVLLQHPAVAEAASFAIPHRTLGEDIAAAVVLAPDAATQPEDIVSFVRERLSGFKVPRIVRIVAELPRTSIGKIQRVGLCESLGLADGPGALRLAPAAEPRDELEQTLRRVWREVLEIEAIGVRDDFFDLGGSSLEAVSMFSIVEGELGTEVPLVDSLFERLTIEELASLLRGQGGS